MIRPAPAIEAIPATTPFVGPEQLMRETGQRELVRLGANESAFGPSPKAVEAMAGELERLAWYGDPESLDLRDELAQRLDCDPAQIIVGSGIDDLMGLAVRAYVAPGGLALTTRGTYPTFNYHVGGFGGALAYAPYRADGRLDLDALSRMARELRPSMLYLANPDNPSGTFVDRTTLENFFDDLPRDCVLFLDEAYADFADERELMPHRFEDRLVRARTFSKAYGMAGARIGYSISTTRVASVFQKIRLHYGINRNAQVGALASLRDDAFRDRVVRQTAEAREEYYKLARDLGFGYIESRTNFVCIDVGSAQRAAWVLKELLARGVWIRKPGAPPLDRYVRVSAGTPPMRRAFADAFREVLREAPVA